MSPDPSNPPAGEPPNRSADASPAAAPLAAAKTAGKKPAGRRPQGKSPRRRSREFALQGLYEWLLSGSEAGVIDAHMREQEGFDKCDSAHFDALLHGCIRDAAALDAALARHVDRRTSALSPVEHGVLLIGAWELSNCLEIPYKVAINEAVELAKEFGGTDGHKYVNGVLDKTAGDLRAVEVAAVRAARQGGAGA
ncbi:MAG: transcription antitermination factor NusB [Betaproteobacteria bacterium]